MFSNVQGRATAEGHSLHLEIDVTRLARIIDSAVVACSEVVNFHLTALSQADLAQPVEIPGLRFKIGAPPLTAEQRREMHESWILARAFQELLRAVRHALEEAHIMASLLTKEHKIRSESSLEEFLRPYRSKAAGLKFPCLIASVNSRLEPKLEFSDAYESLQQARNCLEHRAGIVSKSDTHGQAQLLLKVPRVKIFYERAGQEIELREGEVVDPGEGKSEAEILMKLEARERSIQLGQRITFSAIEFNEVLFACHFLGAQLATRMPKPKLGLTGMPNP
jgi:hypothetical protein